MRTLVPHLISALLCCSCCATGKDQVRPAESEEVSTAGVPASKPATPAVHFGLNGGYAPPPYAPAPDLAREMAALDDFPPMMLRQPGWADVTWAFRNPEPGVFDWAMSDEMFIDSRHPLIGQLYAHMGIPYIFGADFSQRTLESKAREGGRQAVAEYFKANAVDLSDPTHREHARAYVTAVVERYRDHIDYWELGTEVTLEPTLLALMEHSYGWVKEADPTSKVLMPGIAGTNVKMFYHQLEAMDANLARGMGQYFDIAGYHDYGPVDGLEKRYDDFAAVLARHGLDVPIWVSETGTSSNSDSRLSGASSEARQAREVVQRLVILAGKGADVVLWHNFKYCDRKSVFAGCNIVDRRDGPKPAYHTFKLLVEQINDYRTAEKRPFSGGRLYRFTFADRTPVFVAWSDAETTLDLSVDLTEATVTGIVETSGTATPSVQAVSAREIPVSPSPVFITGS